MQTLAALDALVAKVLSDSAALIGQLVIACIGLVIAWVMHRRAKISAAADGAVAEVEALTQPARHIYGEQKKREAARRLAERVHLPPEKLDGIVQAAWERREERMSKPPMFPPDESPTVPERPAVRPPPPRQ